MSFVVSCVLSLVCCSLCLCVVCCLLFAVCCLLCVVHCVYVRSVLFSMPVRWDASRIDLVYSTMLAGPSHSEPSEQAAPAFMEL